MGVAFAVFVAALVFAEAQQFQVETQGLVITEPGGIAGHYESALGDFGLPLYGGSLLGNIKYPKDNSEGCESFPEGLFVGNGVPIIALLDRGGCYFVEKAFKAQQAGATAVLVTDNQAEPLITMANPVDDPEAARLSTNINIPATLITKALGESIKQSLNQGARVVASLDWTEAIVHEDARVEWQLWSTTSQKCGSTCTSTTDFVNNFAPTAIKLESGGNTKFEPHYLSWGCNAGDVECAEKCIYSGRYCAEIDTAKVNGSAVVEENLRHLCVFKTARDGKEQPWLWWNYASWYQGNCTVDLDKYNDVECANEQMRNAGFSDNEINKVAACVGDVTTEGSNQLLEDERKLQEDPNHPTVVLLPTVLINENQYRGRLTTDSVLRALCSGFAEGKEPDACLSASMQHLDCAEDNGGCWKSSDGSISACVETFRGAICICPSGTVGTGKTCKDIDECTTLSPCDQHCENTEPGYKCSCDNGYKLIGETACIMRDLCDEGPEPNGGCSDLCIPSYGYYNCSCRPGFMLEDDDKTCKAMVIPEKGNTGIGTTAVISIVAIAILIVVPILAYAIYKWRARTALHEEVRSVLSEYMSLPANANGEAPAEL